MSRTHRIFACTLASLFAVFSFMITQAWAASTHKLLYSFSGKPDGANPYGPLIFDSAGNLYGTTWSGGTNGFGTVFKLTLSGGKWTETVLHNFSGDPNDGSNPESRLVFDKSGNIYGTTWYGGQWASGTVFELSPRSDGTWKQTILVSFNCCNGSGDAANPNSGVFLDANGNIYGTTEYGGDVILCYGDEAGCGAFFELSPSGSGWKETVLYSFAQTPDAALPWGDLIQDKAGNFYDTSLFGGAQEYSGTVFELSPAGGGGWTESVIYTDENGEGIDNELGGLIFNSQGNLYGVGGSGVFELVKSPEGWKETNLYKFGNPPAPSNPYAGVVLYKNSILYGTTDWGGGGGESCQTNGCGTVYELRKINGAWQEHTLYNFSNPVNGAEPQAAVVLDSAGNLYGTTVNGGAYGNGTVYEITP